MPRKNLRSITSGNYRGERRRTSVARCTSLISLWNTHKDGYDSSRVSHLPPSIATRETPHNNGRATRGPLWSLVMHTLSRPGTPTQQWKSDTRAPFGLPREIHPARLVILPVRSPRLTLSSSGSVAYASASFVRLMAAQNRCGRSSLYSAWARNNLASLLASSMTRRGEAGASACRWMGRLCSIGAEDWTGSTSRCADVR